MSKRILASTLLALFLIAAVIAPAAAATHITYCFTFQGKEYCINIPLAYKIIFKVPQDKPQEAVDVSTVMDSFKAIYRTGPSPQPWLRSLVENQGQTQWYLVDGAGKHVVLLDMANQAALELPAETEIGQ